MVLGIWGIGYLILSEWTGMCQRGLHLELGVDHLLTFLEFLMPYSKCWCGHWCWNYTGTDVECLIVQQWYTVAWVLDSSTRVLVFKCLIVIQGYCCCLIVAQGNHQHLSDAKCRCCEVRRRARCNLTNWRGGQTTKFCLILVATWLVAGTNNKQP